MIIVLFCQHRVTFERGLAEAGDHQERGGLYQQLMELTDLILDGYKTQLESIKQNVGETPHFLEVLRKYEQDRSALIMPFSKIYIPTIQRLNEINDNYMFCRMASCINVIKGERWFRFAILMPGHLFKPCV